MKNIKLALLFIAILFCFNAFAQGGDRDGDGVLDKDDVCPDAKGTALNKGCPDEKKTAPLVSLTLEETITAIINEGKKNFLFSENVLEELPANYFGGEEKGDRNFKFGLSLGGDGEYIRYVDKLKKRVFYSDFYGLSEESKRQGEKVKETLEKIFKEFEKTPGYSVFRKKDMVTLYDANKVVVIGYWMNDDKSLLYVTTR